MSKIAIITDSTANLPADFVEKYGIEVAPLNVIFGEEVYLDGVDLSPEEFYTRLPESSVLPTTSQVTVGVYKKMFERLHGAGREILVITLSSKLSGTMDSAVQARAMVPGAVIEIVDSLATSVQLGLIVLEAARAAEGGGSLADCIQAVEAAREKSRIYFAVDTLEYLHRGGRIGGAKRLLGTVLNIKPILTLAEGSVSPQEQARTRRKSMARLAGLTAAFAAGGGNPRVAVGHASAPEDAEKLLALFQEQVPGSIGFITELSPVIGTHTGPGTLAISAMID
jgi:DegV family protein with EDD domain